MIPENRDSTVPAPAPWLHALPASASLDSYAIGGVALGDSSHGLDVKVWRARYVDGTVVLSAESTPDTVAFSRPNVTHLSLAFDQNMNPFIAFVQAGQAKFWWYDPLAGEQAFDESTLGSIDAPVCTLDETRKWNSGESDIIIGYVRDGGRHYRQQRDRYAVERLLSSGIPPYTRVRRIGMNTKLRLQWELETYAL